ncbi:hypothetical protein FOCC_FOCC011684 [Frankliniella occidentalis]|nr:hypothetical protein FOCC_FOCC011684 [Frankliniella occidentalis]
MPYQQRFESSTMFPTHHLQPTGSIVANQFGPSRPAWYDPYSDNFRASSQPHLILDIEKADLELHTIISSGRYLEFWRRVEYIRQFIQNGFVTFVLSDIKFLHKENADQQLWKILFHNLIELLRKGVSEGGPDADHQKKLLLQIIDDGTQFFESLLVKLQDKYGFRLDDFLSGADNTSKLTTVMAVAILVAQKIYLFLGDLARYREQANETSNYGKARQNKVEKIAGRAWYLKAHQINPKSGRPYNQLAILAVYARRKIDAVYYYMRGLMASNFVVHTARENLLSLFDENRKKWLHYFLCIPEQYSSLVLFQLVSRRCFCQLQVEYLVNWYEQTEKKRREEREAKERSRMLEKEGGGPPSLRREVWHHPNNGQRVSRTTSNTVRPDHSDTEEELAKLSSVDLNKRFVMSFMHIHGKLFTKVGMETFQEAAVQMLKEFHALLQHTPIPLNANRFLQLLALNMFAIENTQLKGEQHLFTELFRSFCRGEERKRRKGKWRWWWEGVRYTLDL